MAFDAPRKTLDDIRREIDADYPRTIAPISVDNAATTTLVEGPTPSPCDEDHLAAFDGFYERALKARRGRRWSLSGRRGYIAAGFVGCVFGQLVLLGYQAATRHLSTSGTPDVQASPVGAMSAPSPSAVPPAPAITTGPSVASISSSNVQPLAESRVSSDAIAPDSAPPRSVPSAIPGPVANEPKPAPRRVARPTTSMAASRPAPSAVRAEPPARIPTAEEWVKSQEEVRAALRDWLSESNSDAVDVRAAETVVILGADGRTARTHVPMRSGDGVVVHELRWKHEADRWSVVENREAWRAR